MCTTNLCIALYVLSLCSFAWFGVVALIMIRSSKDQGNFYIIDPLVKWFNTELLIPAECFNKEAILPVLKYLKVSAKEWNKVVGSKPELTF